jgi:3-deoxy-D-manno-octulosonic-acid transferase
VAKAPLSLGLYRFAAGAAAPLASAWLRARAERGKEDPARWGERLGRTDAVRPSGPLVWLHGVSVGESLALLPLIHRLGAQRPDASVLVTSGTRVSAELLARRLPSGVIHQYAPLDIPAAVERFLDHWRPALGVFVESELWPNLILAARARGTRLALVSAKLSGASERGWRRAPAAARAVLGAFDLILARDAAIGNRLAGLGGRVDGLADLKFGAAPLPVDEAALTEARRALAGRPVLLAASTHPGEDEIVLAAYAAARSAGASRLIIAPRHPERGATIEAAARAAGLAAGLRSDGATLGEEDVHVADAVGELGLWYRLAALAIVGGSLVPGGVGGHNPLEPARLDCPFVSGPEVTAWPVYDTIAAAGATALVRVGELAGWFERAVRGDAELAAMAKRAHAFVAEGDAAAGGAVERVVGLLPR